MKSICMFCGKDHKSKIKPAMCQAKGEIMTSLTQQFGTRDYWKILHGVETGLIPLTDLAIKHIAMKNKEAVQLGRIGGSVKSKRKAKSSRLNGKLGGRPKKPKPTTKSPSK